MWKYRQILERAVALRQMSAFALVAATGVLVGFGLAREASTAAALAAHPVDWDGHRWSEFSPEEKSAYLGGFLAGAAASQAYEGLSSEVEFDAEALAGNLAKLRADRALNFPYGQNIYHVRIHDYYFYVDRLDRPIYRAIAELNFQLQVNQR